MPACHELAACQVKDGSRGCHCVDGYRGDGIAKCESIIPFLFLSILLYFSLFLCYLRVNVTYCALYVKCSEAKKCLTIKFKAFTEGK